MNCQSAELECLPISYVFSVYIDNSSYIFYSQQFTLQFIANIFIKFKANSLLLITVQFPPNTVHILYSLISVIKSTNLYIKMPYNPSIYSSISFTVHQTVKSLHSHSVHSGVQSPQYDTLESI